MPSMPLVARFARLFLARSWPPPPAPWTCPRSVGVLLIAVLHFIPDADDPFQVVARLMDAMPLEMTAPVRTGRAPSFSRTKPVRPPAPAASLGGQVARHPIQPPGRSANARPQSCANRASGTSSRETSAKCKAYGSSSPVSASSPSPILSLRRSRSKEGKGAFCRFKDQLHEEHPGLLSAWYAFLDARATRRAVQWLADNSLIDDEAADRFLTGHPDPDLP
jgi:S-adenosyl methyltransferase